MPGTTWCTNSYRPVGGCPDHTGEHREVRSPLGPDDEPRSNGALVLVWPDDYRMQEVWTASGANIGNWYCLIGNWYCLGDERRRPAVWDPPRREIWDRSPEPPRPTGSIPVQPDWFDVLKRGPVSLLTHDNATAYRAGWRNGRRSLHEEIESLAEDDSGAY